MSNNEVSNILNNYQDTKKKENEKATNERQANEELFLPTYKKVVYKKVKYYGLSQNNFNQVQKKIKRQDEFLKTTFYHDKIRNIDIPLKNLIVSSNHNPNRYYAQIQNIVNTMATEAKFNSLTPIFMTVTLPSEYHGKRKHTRTGKLIRNPKFIDDEKHTPSEGAKEITRMIADLRNERSLRSIPKYMKHYYRVNEPHEDGTPHAHILMFVPLLYVDGIKKSFNRLFMSTSSTKKANDIQLVVNNAAAYVMKYINKTLPLSKQETLTEKEKYINAWYSHNRVRRFCASRTLAPMTLYKLLNSRYTLRELTHKKRSGELREIVLADDRSKIMELFDGDELIYEKNINFSVVRGDLANRNFGE